MPTILTWIFLMISTTILNAQLLEVQTFGNEKDIPLIFLHGGPGYNSVTFEGTTAEELAKNGFFVISYDRRGEGRNGQLKAEYSFEQTFEDLNQIYLRYNLQRANLIGHSFGGIIATLFAEKYPQKITTLVLVSTPISMQKTFKNIINRSKVIYEDRNDRVNLNYIQLLENMDSTGLEYSTYCFAHAMSNGFYSPKEPSEEAVHLYNKFRKDSLSNAYASKMENLAPVGFWKNEHYTTISVTENINRIRRQKIDIYGIYGKEDGLFSEEQVYELRNLLDDNSLLYLEDCSHNVFIDQQRIFIDALVNWAK